MTRSRPRWRPRVRKPLPRAMGRRMAWLMGLLMALLLPLLFAQIPPPAQGASRGTPTAIATIRGSEDLATLPAPASLVAAGAEPSSPLAAAPMVVAAKAGAGAANAEAGVTTCRMGVYIEDLRDFNFAGKSLFASLRIWSVCPSADLKPLADLQISNGNELTIGEVKTRFEPNHSRAFPGKSGLYWSEIGVSGSFYYSWSAQNFPFDRHHLSFEIVPRGVSDADFVITPDYQNSGFNPRIGSSEWIASDFLIGEQTLDQGSSFGNPAQTSGDGRGISTISASLDLRRARITSFLKMCAGVYAAVVISALAFYMDPREPDLVSGRTGLCVGCLFAAIVNMQQAESTLGISEDVTLTDQIHIIAILFILISTILAIVSYLRCERDQADRAQHFDRRVYLPIFSISYLVMNAVIISYAILVG